MGKSLSPFLQDVQEAGHQVAEGDTINLDDVVRGCMRDIRRLEGGSNAINEGCRLRKLGKPIPPKLLKTIRSFISWLSQLKGRHPENSVAERNGGKID